MAKLTFRDYFSPLSTLKIIEGTVRNQREVMLWNHGERERVATIAHRWAQIAGISLLMGLWCDTRGLVGGQVLCFLAFFITSLAASVLGMTWLALVLMKRDLDKQKAP